MLEGFLFIDRLGNIDKQLSENRYLYPKKAYETVKLPKRIKLIPSVPDKENFKLSE